MNDISVIIPIHMFDKDSMSLLSKAIESVPEDIQITLSCNKDADIEKLPFETNRKVTILKACDTEAFIDLVNTAVQNIDTQWFSILEFDDTYTPIWFKNVEEYIAEMPNVSVFIPIEDILDFQTEKYINYGNAEAWASSFSNELGYLDNECLQNYFDFYLTGSVFKKEDWLEVGGLKPHIKITFWYEWMLRATNKGKRIYVIPKRGYVHYLGRPYSLVELYKTSVSQEEAQWWFDLAKKDSFFKEEKDASYYVYKKKDENEPIAQTDEKQ